jgi:hypothetical protein
MARTNRLVGVLASVAGCVLPGAFASAQIRSIEGTIADGAQIRLVGSGFGTKPFGAKPYAFFDFGKGQGQSSALSRNSWHAPVNGVLDGAVVAPGRSAAWRCKLDPTQPGSDSGSLYDCWAGDGRYGDVTGMQLNTEARDYYIFARLYYNWDGADAYARRSDWNIKGFRFWGDTSFYVLGAGQTNAPDGATRSGLAGGTPGYDISYPEPVGTFGIQKNAWRVQENFVRQSSANGATDGYWTARVNRVLLGSYTSGGAGNIGDIPNMRTRTSKPFDKLAWHQMQYHGFTTADGKYIAYDTVYIDDSWARVVATDSSTWSDKTETSAYELQVPVSWADGAIDVVLRKGVLGALDGKYLYVFRSDGSLVSSNGFRISGAPAPLPPGKFSAN